MNVLTRTLRHLTVEECERILRFKWLVKAELYDYGDEETREQIQAPSDQPAIIQEWYSEWLRDDHYPLSPVNKDHADDLWLKFCEEVGR